MMFIFCMPCLVRLALNSFLSGTIKLCHFIFIHETFWLAKVSHNQSA